MKEKNYNIGLLGGSFNPPHPGHLFISHDALQRFKLDYVWWVITPQNPLKPKTTSSLEERKKWCEQLIDSPKIIVTDIEKNILSNHTYDLLQFLLPQHQNHNYIWLMGFDNLINFEQWHQWQEILETIKLAVYRRKNYPYTALSAKLLKYQKPLDQFLDAEAPCWSEVVVNTPDISSTMIRNNEYT